MVRQLADYKLENTATVNLEECSGITHRDDDTDVLYIVSDNHEVRVTDRSGAQIQGDIALPTSVFNDTEAIAYLGSRSFAIISEGPPVKLHTFILDIGQSVLDAGDVTTYQLDDITTHSDATAGTLGAEGMDWNPLDSRFYVMTQSVQDGEGGF